jgi:hypothetical protein
VHLHHEVPVLGHRVLGVEQLLHCQRVVAPRIHETGFESLAAFEQLLGPRSLARVDECLGEAVHRRHVVGRHGVRGLVERQRIREPVERDQVVAEDPVRLGPIRVTLERARAERFVLGSLVQQPGRCGAMAERCAVVAIDAERDVEHARRVAVAAIVEDVGRAQHDRFDAAFVALDHAIQEMLGLGRVERRIGAADPVEREQRFFVVAVVLDHLVDVLLTAREVLGLAVGLELQHAERRARFLAIGCHGHAVDEGPTRCFEVRSPAEPPQRTPVVRELHGILRRRQRRVLLPQLTRARPLAVAGTQLPELVPHHAVLGRRGDELHEDLERPLVVADARESLLVQQRGVGPGLERRRGTGHGVANLLVLPAAQIDLQQADLRLVDDRLLRAIRLGLLREGVEQLLERGLGRGQLALLQLALGGLQHVRVFVVLALRRQDPEQAARQKRAEHAHTHTAAEPRTSHRGAGYRDSRPSVGVIRAARAHDLGTHLLELLDGSPHVVGDGARPHVVIDEHERRVSGGQHVVGHTHFVIHLKTRVAERPGASRDFDAHAELPRPQEFHGGFGKHEWNLVVAQESEVLEIQEAGLLHQGEIDRVVDHAGGVEVRPTQRHIRDEAVEHVGYRALVRPRFRSPAGAIP